MMTGVVVTAPLSDRVFHAGATGYGWLNGGWGVGAFLSALYAPALIARVGARCSIALSMLLLTLSMALSPFSPVAGGGGTALWADGIGARRQRRGHEYQPDGAGASAVYGTRAEHFLFLRDVSAGGAWAGVGWIASRISLAAGFGVIAAVYAVAFGSACWPVRAQKAVAAVAD